MDDLQTVLMVVFSAVVAGSTVAYALLTRNLVRETALLRRAQTEPQVSVYLTPGQRWLHMLELVVRNSGQGGARDIRCAISASDANLEAHNVHVDCLRLLEHILYLAPGEEIRSFFGDASNFLEEPPLEEFSIAVEYNTEMGELRQREFRIRPIQYGGVARLGELPEHEVAKSLVSLSKDLHSLVSEHRLSVLTISQDELDERKTAQRQRYEERRKKDDAADGSGSGEDGAE
ncbi:hypothetical protein KAT82_04810 [bacterium]|nr:hypothetical protein [bacterium]